MEFIATHWYIWALVTLFSLAHLFFSQLKIMKEFDSSSSFSKGENFFLEGYKKIFFAAVVGGVGIVLLFVSLVMNIIDYIAN